MPSTIRAFVLSVQAKNLRSSVAVLSFATPVYHESTWNDSYGNTKNIPAINIEDVIENGKKFGKKGDECENIKNDLNSNLSTDNLKKYVEKCGENIVINGSIRDNDLQRWHEY